MSDFISRQAAIEAVCKALYTPIPCYGNSLLQDCMTLAKAIVNNIPSEEPERTGRWVLWNEPGCEYAKCTACGEMYDQDDLYIGGNDYPKFCPNCGAKME